jgi:hypothetical protein
VEAGAGIGDGDDGADTVVSAAAVGEDGAASDDLSFEHPTAPKIAKALRPAAATALR